MESGEERRKHPRRPCDRPFEARTAKEEPGKIESFPCHAVNVSDGGMMIESRRELEVGRRIELFLKTRDNSRSLVAEAEVVWTKRSGDVCRSGVKFIRRREEYVI